jgi:hypothetical protein
MINKYMTQGMYLFLDISLHNHEGYYCHNIIGYDMYEQYIAIKQLA